MGDVRIGLLGCGRIAQYAHVGALVKADNVALTAVCDPVQERAMAAARRADVSGVFTDHRAFLDRGGFDAVLITAPDALHLQLVADCLEAGKHVLVEKPVAATVAEAEEIARLVEISGLRLQVGYMKRFDPGLQFAQRFVMEEMGARLAVSAWYCDTTARPQMEKSLLPPLAGRAGPSLERSPEELRRYKLVTHGAHLVDLLRYFGGAIVGLQARLTERDGAFSWHAVVGYADGASGHLELTLAARMDWFEGIHIHGEHGSVTGRIAWPFFHQPSATQVFDARRGEYRTPQAPDADAYERQVEAFAQAVQGNRAPSPDVYDGIAGLRVLAAVERSIAEQRWVEVDG